MVEDRDKIAHESPTLMQAKDMGRIHVMMIKTPVMERSVGNVEVINTHELNALQKMNYATIAR